MPGCTVYGMPGNREGRPYTVFYGQVRFPVSVYSNRNQGKREACPYTVFHGEVSPITVY